MATPTTGSGTSITFANASDMTVRYSPGLIGDLLADDGNRVLDLDGNAKLTAILNTATGKVMASLVQSDRYTIEQLESLGDTSNTSYNKQSYEYLVDIICRVAWWLLWQRKPWDDSSEGARRQAQTESDTILKMLRDGTEILVLGSSTDAGKPNNLGVKAVQATTLWSQAGRGRWYPTNKNVDRSP
jgi:hypothetical protein|tara:strand:- start:25 stop:582 length:558 start_codon:yes stop_codon:yes gene_type:complete